MRLKTLTRGAVVCASVAALAALGAQTANAAPVPPPTIDYNILWGITDGTLAVQGEPFVGNVITTLTPDTNTVSVICQTVNGGTDWIDGYYSTTWDEIWLGNQVGFVYDTFIDTPSQPPQGGYSQGTNEFGQGAPPPCPGG